MENKTNVVPGPGTYDVKLREKLTGLFKCNEGRGQFIDHYKAIGMDTPGSIYNTNVGPIKPKILTTKVFPESKHDKDKYKVKKSDLPAPGTYDIEKPTKLI